MVKIETNAIHPTAFLNQPVAAPHQPRFAQQLFNFGMIATGNHNFEKFAALCNTPGGSQGVQTISVYALLQGVYVQPGACENRGCGRMLSAPTERVLFILLYVLKSNLSY